jgi:hypothetical protein
MPPTSRSAASAVSTRSTRSQLRRRGLTLSTGLDRRPTQRQLDRKRQIGGVGSDPEPVTAGFVLPAAVPVSEEPGRERDRSPSSFAGAETNCGESDEPADGPVDGGLSSLGVHLDDLLTRTRAAIGHVDDDQHRFTGDRRGLDRRGAELDLHVALAAAEPVRGLGAALQPGPVAEVDALGGTRTVSGAGRFLADRLAACSAVYSQTMR